MKIVRFTAENVKKLVAVEIKPDGNLVQITGKNGQGKTSVLDAIWWALEGAAHIQAEPIRKGSDTAKIQIDLGQMVVTRTFRKDEAGKTASGIVVENADGARFSSPQALLDGLLGALTFDPLQFARTDMKSQFNTLRKFVPEVDFDAIDIANRKDYETRTVLNRKAKELRTMGEQIQADLTGPKKEKIDEAELVEEMKTAGQMNAELEVRKAKRASAVESVARDRAEAERLFKQAEALQIKADELQQKIDDASELPKPVDVAGIQAKITQARSVNAEIDRAEKKAAYLNEAKKVEMEAEGLTMAMAKREEEKRQKIQAASLPVPGLSFGDGTVLLNGVPFTQASDAEQLKVSIAIAMAMNPKLRVIRIRDGSLLDDDAMKLLGEMANEKDYQLWIERVDGSGKVGFVLEDGHLKAAQ